MGSSHSGKSQGLPPRPHKVRSFWDSTKFALLAGAGFFADGYINFVIGLITPILGYLYYPQDKNTVPANISDTVSGIFNLGMIFGQLGFGLLGDRYGRSKIYGKELLITVFGTIMCCVVPRSLSTNGVMAWFAVFRFIAGVGVGGDYSLTSGLAVERDNMVRWRGALVTGVFCGQAFGRVASAIVFYVLLQIYKGSVEKDVHKLEFVWRLLLGLGCIPAIFAIYGRFTMKETDGYETYVKHKHDEDPEVIEDVVVDEESSRTWKDSLNDLREYYSKWKHLKILIAICVSWCLFDIADYGLSLNQGTVLTLIGFGSGDNTWEKLGNLIVQVSGVACGFWAAVPVIDPLGRLRLEFISVVACCIMYAVWAGMFNSLNKGAFTALYTLTSFFLNIGPSQVTYLWPSEVFPTRVRATSQGICSASGKVGAVISGFAFAKAKEKIGFVGLLGLFSGCLGVVAIFTVVMPETSRLTLDELETDIVDIPGRSFWDVWTKGIIKTTAEEFPDRQSPIITPDSPSGKYISTINETEIEE